MTVKGNEKLVQWGLGIAGSLILSLGGWVYSQGAAIEVLKEKVSDNERQLQNVWRNYNTALDQKEIAIQRLVRVENCCENIKDDVDEIKRSIRWRNNSNN